MEGILEGWVKSYRKIEEWKYYKRPCHAHLFQHIVRRANFKDGYNSSAQLIKRGEMDYTLRLLADQTGLTKKQVENILKDLKSGTEIGTVYLAKNQKEFSILSVTNYEKYQGEDTCLAQSIGTAIGTAGGRQGDSRGTAGGHPKELKNENNAKNERKKRAVATPVEILKGPIWGLPKIDIDFYNALLESVSHEFQTAQMQKFGADVIESELIKIRNWVIKNPGKWAKKKDYEAFLVNWFEGVTPNTGNKAVAKALAIQDKNELLKKELTRDCDIININ